MTQVNQDYSIPQNTVSEQIIQYIMATLANVDFDPARPHGNNSGPLLFDIVKRGTMNDIMPMETPAAAIEEGTESKIALSWPFEDKSLRVYINFKIANQIGVDRFSVIRYYFGRIVKLFVTDGNALGGLAIDCTEAGNTPEVNGLADKEPGGTVVLDIQYRHRHGDMFTGL